MTTDTTAVHLRRVDPTKNMARFYAMSVHQNLFGNWSLVREWGRIGSKGRLVATPLDSEHEATVAMAAFLKSKLKRGYAAV